MNQSQKVPVERLTYRMNELSSALNFYIGRAPLWTKQAVNNWIEQGGHRQRGKAC
jgi:hypothetical protein